MFLIGEFSRIARLSTRQLRHYDELGLFKPVHIDPETGYRYYSAAQLPQLNHLLALKKLGLGLDQIARLLNDNISVEEIRGMLMLKKAQVEQTLRDELARIKSIEERLRQIETQGTFSDEDVVLKSIPRQHFLSFRQMIPSIGEGFKLMYSLHQILPHPGEKHVIGHFGVMFHSDMAESESLDVEMGFLTETESFHTLALSDGRRLSSRSLPPVETMASMARIGIDNNSLGNYAALAAWIERHDYQIIGPGWEVFLQPFAPGKEDEVVLEIQFPVQKIDQPIRR